MSHSNQPPHLPPPPSTSPSDAESQAAIKRVRKVRFSPYVHKLMLPLEEAEEAHEARKSKIKEAPYNDELWEGDEGDFREKELTPDELWTLRLRERVGALPRKFFSKPLKTGMKALFQSLSTPKHQDIDAVYSHAKKMVHQESAETAADLVKFAKEKPIRRFGAQLTRQNSSMSRKPSEMILSEFAGAPADKILARFDSLAKQIETLKRAPEDLLQQENVLVSQLLELNRVKEDLANLRFDIPELERKLERNANSKFFTMYTNEKTRQLQLELKQLRNKQKQLLARLSQLGGEIFTTNKQIENLGEALVTLRASEAELFDIETYVVNRYLKQPDMVLQDTMLAIDEMKRLLEREEHTKLKLRQACEVTLPQQVLVNLNEAKSSLLDSNELLSTIFAKHQANPKSPMYVGVEQPQPGGKKVDEVSLLVMRRREVLNRARECALVAVDTLNRVLDDLEESSGHDNWSESVLKWRLEVPNMLQPELFGIATRKPPLQEEINAEANRKFKERVAKRLAAIALCTELTNRYIGFFQREILRSKNRSDKLAAQKERLKQELLQRRKEVFEEARRNRAAFDDAAEEDMYGRRYNSFDDTIPTTATRAQSMDFSEHETTEGGGEKRERGVSMDVNMFRKASRNLLAVNEEEEK